MHESKHIEYKQKITPELEKEVVAFLNSNEGGVIYIGIDKTGKIVGVENPDEGQLLLKDRFKHNILPSCMGLFDIVLEKKEDKNVLKIIVAGGYEKPYYVKKYGLSEKGVFIRVGSSAEPMPTRQIEQLFSKRTRNSIGRIKSPKQDLRFQQLQIYYQSTGKLLNEQFAKNLELLTEDNQYNYVAYLLNDVNGISVKVAKYSGENQVDLIENEEYGYESLIKATKQVLDKLNLENKTITKITSKERQEKRLWDSIALREAVINAFVHNDYTREIAPKFEIFRDRLVITSYGGLPEGLSQEEFFTGFSVPRNKELMRIYKDLELVEQLGSGIPRILQVYTKEQFKFSENFLQIILPAEEDAVLIPQVTPQVTPQVEKLLQVFEGNHFREELQEKLGLLDRENFRKMYLQPAIEQGLVALTLPDKPTSSKQQYYLTEKGKGILSNIVI
ncbi:Fic family protein [Bergeyella zoohelcum]|uniref:Fic family protein n=1 Tax=Bergeyella zoohelcum TaxID=1015 RepID=UPI0037369522